jgi:hypothetical protein
LPEAARETDAIARVDKDTKEYEFIYETQGKARIVGYIDGNVYIFLNREIKRHNIETGEETTIVSDLRKETQYSFEICGEKIFIWSRENLIGAYDV